MSNRHKANPAEPCKELARDLARPPKVRHPKTNGGRLYAGGVPGHRGGGGRPPNWLKQFCDDLLADPKVQDVVRRALYGEEIPATTVALWRAAADRAQGKPKEFVEHAGEVGARVVLVPEKAPDAETWAARAREDAARRRLEGNRT